MLLLKKHATTILEYLKQKSWTLGFPSISHIGPLMFLGWKKAWPPLRSSMRHDEPSWSEPIWNLHGESMVGNLWLKFSKNIGTNIARIWIILDHVSHRSLFLFVVCVFSVYSRGRGWMREWMTRVQTAGVRFEYPPNLIHLSSSHQAFPDENCPKPKSERNFQKPFSRLLGFFWVGGPEVFSRFFHKMARVDCVGVRGTARQCAFRRWYAELSQGCSSRGVWGMGKINPKSVGGKYTRWNDKDACFKEGIIPDFRFFFWNP